MTPRPALAVALSLLFFVGACGPDHKEAEAAKTGIDGAFAAAFPNGATEKDANGNTLTFAAKQLVPVKPDGSVQALISEGSLGQDASHVDTGALRITYLNSSDGAFTLSDPAVQQSLPGDGFGAPPKWRIVQRHHKPAIIVEYSYGNQGCTDTTVDVYILDAASITKDKHASKPMKEICDGSGDSSNSASDENLENDPAARAAAQIAGANANWDSYDREHPDRAPKTDGGNTSTDSSTTNATASTPQ